MATAPLRTVPTARPGGAATPPNARILLAALLVAASGPALAAEEPPRQTLRRVQEEIEADRTRQRVLDRQSDAIQRELEELRGRLVTLADDARAREEELDRLEADLAGLEQRERAEADRLDGERRQIASLLAALQRLSRIPPEAVIARPEGPVDTLRSALMLRETVPVLRIRAEALSASLAALADTRERLQAKRARTLSARLALDTREQEIAGLVARREELSRQTAEERASVARHMAALSGQAADLRQLMERIEQERRAAAEAAARIEAARIDAERREAERAAAAARDAAKQAAKETERREAARAEAERKAAEQRARIAAAPRAPEPPPAPSRPESGGLRLPVGGAVSLRYGEPDRFGAPSRGMTIAARPGAPVTAPSAGTVVFAGPFRGYGLILIVEHRNGYHSLIAGLGRIDTIVGTRVATGEPIATMPASADGTADLYFELRRHGQPINPQRGFATADAKGQG